MGSFCYPQYIEVRLETAGSVMDEFLKKSVESLHAGIGHSLQTSSAG